MIKPEDSGALADTEYFVHTHACKNEFHSGDMVTMLKWNIVGQIINHPYIYLGEVCCDVETSWGSLWEEMPITALRPYDPRNKTHEINLQRGDSYGEDGESRSVLLQPLDIDLSYPVRISDLQPI